VTTLWLAATNEQITDLPSIKKQLNRRGIFFDNWPITQTLSPTATQDDVLTQYHSYLAPFMANGGYKTADVIQITPDTPNIAALREKFLREHTHTEDEVRFFIAGQGVFWFHIGDEVLSLLCKAGDLLSVPANTKHWFDLLEKPSVKAIRIFTDQAGWVAHYTGSGIDERYTFPRSNS
jgi:1,2-dihydroxy-3-keto-5-methylthiopentene dioxygenase